MVHFVKDLFVVIWLRLLHLMQRIKKGNARENWILVKLTC